MATGDTQPNNGAGPDQEGGSEFSIGEASAMVGVSTHVLRSWERRLSLGLNQRTASNQRRYSIGDIRSLIEIRQLHEEAGLPLVQSASRVLAQKAETAVPKVDVGVDVVDEFWAGLIDTFPEILIVIDDSGRIAAANEAARNKLNFRHGSLFAGLAPAGWHRSYTSIHSLHRGSQPTLLAMRARSGTIFLEARVQPVGRRPDGPMVLIGRQVRDQAPTHMPADLRGAPDG